MLIYTFVWKGKGNQGKNSKCPYRRQREAWDGEKYADLIFLK